MRVIPDVDVNAERSEKQKEESSKFGFLSDMLNQNLEYLKIGFPKVYQPLNYAIKKNISLVSNTENGFEFDFPKAIFSEGKLAPCSPVSLSTYSTVANPFSVRFDFNNDSFQQIKNDYDRVYAIIYLPQIKKLLIKKTAFRRVPSTPPPRCYFPNLNSYINQDAQCSLFFNNGKISSNTIYFGQIRLRW